MTSKIQVRPAGAPVDDLTMDIQDKLVLNADVRNAMRYASGSSTASALGKPRGCHMSIKFSIILLSVLLIVVALAVVIMVNFVAHKDTGTKLGADVREQTIANVRLQVVDLIHQPHDESLKENFYLRSGVVNLNDNPADNNLPSSAMIYQAKVMATRTFLGAIYVVNKRGFAGYFRAGDAADFLTLTNWDSFRPGELLFAPSDADGNVDYSVADSIPYNRSVEDWINFAFTLKTPTWSPIYTVPTEKNTLFISAYHPIVNTTTGGTDAFTGVDLTTLQLDKFMSRIKLGKTGVVFLLEASTGFLISKSAVEGSSIKYNEDDSPTPMLASECGNSAIQDAVTVLGSDLSGIRNDTEMKYTDSQSGKRMILNAHPVFDDYGLHWLIVSTVPESDFWGSSQESAFEALYVGIGVAAAATLSSVMLSFMITRPLNKLSGRMDRLSKLEGDLDTELGIGAGDHGEKHKTSLFSEVAVLQQAFKRMVRGLQSYIRFVPLEVVRHMLVSGEVASVGLEPGNTTVLFSDIKDFTVISQKVDPHRLSMLLGEYFQAMSDAITEHEGTIDKFIGDAIMVYWNGITPVQNHPVKAVRAAVSMQRRLDTLRSKWVKQGFPEVYMRIGIATGDVMLGNVGSSSRLNYTIIGETVNIAARLEPLCKELDAKILVDEEIHNHLTEAVNNGEFIARDRGEASVKGYDRLIRVFEVRHSVG